MWLVMVPATAAWLSIPPRVGKLTTRGPSLPILRRCAWLSPVAKPT